MIIYTKYSNERSPEFRIRTDIIKEPDGCRKICKSAASPQAKEHIEKIHRLYGLLEADLAGSGLFVNHCEKKEDGVYFPYLEGKTLEEKLDELLAKKKTDEVIAEIERYFAMFVPERTKSSLIPFKMTDEFEHVFGKVSFAKQQLCRRLSDTDMIFANAIEREDGFELIDYEWTIEFPVPVKFIQYRALHYYILGNSTRDKLIGLDLYGHFGISKEEQEQFAAMEKHFQQYMLGEYTPYWKLYDAISDGVIDANALIKKESEYKNRNKVEIYFDDGRNFGAWNCEKRQSVQDGRLNLEIDLPQGTKAVRLDPCSEKCIVRVKKLRQGKKMLMYTSNGYAGGNGDLIFDTEDPQIIFSVSGNEPVYVSLIIEPMDGITRELILNQYGKLRRLQPQTYVNKVKKILKKK